MQQLILDIITPPPSYSPAHQLSVRGHRAMGAAGAAQAVAPILMNLMGFSCTSTKPSEKQIMLRENIVNKIYLDLVGNLVSMDLFVIHAGLRE